MVLRSIDVFLITGFLGSGKTTFLRYLLDQIKSYSQLKCGVLMNEFGGENVDSDLLPHEENTFTEINGGSIFCSCLHTEFIQALKAFFESTEINTLFIETSGLSNPSMIFQDLSIVNSQIGDVYKIKESICLVDASLIMKLISAFTTISTQLQVSSLVLINKIDLVNSVQLDSVEQVIREENPTTKIFKTKFGKFNLKNLLMPKKIQIQKDLTGRRDVKGEFSSITLTQTAMFSKGKFLDYMQSLNESILRIKGFVNLDNQGWYRVDKVENNLQLEQVTSHPDQGILIVIFREMIDVHKILSQWNTLKPRG